MLLLPILYCHDNNDVYSGMGTVLFLYQHKMFLVFVCFDKFGILTKHHCLRNALPCVLLCRIMLPFLNTSIVTLHQWWEWVIFLVLTFYIFWSSCLNCLLIRVIPALCSLCTAKHVSCYCHIQHESLIISSVLYSYIATHDANQDNGYISVFVVVFCCFLAFDFCRFCVVIRFFYPHHNGQWPPTSKDFLPDFIHYIYFPILILSSVWDGIRLCVGFFFFKADKRPMNDIVFNMNALDKSSNFME